MGPILAGFKSRNVKLDILYLYLFYVNCIVIDVIWLILIFLLKFELYVV